MFKNINRFVVCSCFGVLSFQAQATPVDVNGDGIVGAHEAIDLSRDWKGPAFPQPWQFNGTNTPVQSASEPLRRKARWTSGVQTILTSIWTARMATSISMAAMTAYSGSITIAD